MCGLAVSSLIAVLSAYIGTPSIAAEVVRRDAAEGKGTASLPPRNLIQSSLKEGPGGIHEHAIASHSVQSAHVDAKGRTACRRWGEPPAWGAMNVLRRVGGVGNSSSSSSNANSSQTNAGSDANASSSSGLNGGAGSGTAAAAGGGLGHAARGDGLGGADASSPPEKHFGLENVSCMRTPASIARRC